MHHLRINGRGNAWPIPIGKQHAMYQENNINDYANASFSICKSKSQNYDKNELEWEVLIDAGHGIVPFILNHHNRIPEAIVLTHAHFDHILGVDWIVQSFYRTYKTKYPIYASKACIKAFKTVLHHLEGLVAWHVLEVGVNVPIKETPDLNVTMFPVFHGYSAKGASMLLFNENSSAKKVLITGDILCPLVRQKDLEQFNNLDFILADCNNRFPCPKSNHWSFYSSEHNEKIFSNFADDFEIVNLLKPHYDSTIEKCYVLDLISEINNINDLCWTITKFAKKINAKNIGLVHYSGSEDLKYYNEKIINSKELECWAQTKAKESKIPGNFIVPKTNDLYSIF